MNRENQVALVAKAIKVQRERMEPTDPKEKRAYLVPVIKVTPVSREYQVNQEKMDNQDPTVRKELKEGEETMVRRETKETMVKMDSPDLKDLKALQDQKETLVLQDSQEMTGLWELKANPVFQASKVILVIPDLLAKMETYLHSLLKSLQTSMMLLTLRGKILSILS